MSVTYYHLSNLVKVEQILMVKIMVTIFPSKERHKWLSKRSHKKQTEKTFPFGSLNFFFPNSVSNVCVFCFAILSSNLPGRFMDLLRRFMHLLRRFMHLLAFIISKTSSVYRYAAFPVAVLYNLSLSVWLNGFVISHRKFITRCRRHYGTSFVFLS